MSIADIKLKQLKCLQEVKIPIRAIMNHILLYMRADGVDTVMMKSLQIPSQHYRNSFGGIHCGILSHSNFSLLKASRMALGNIEM